MSILERYYGTIEELTFSLDEHELALRLGTKQGYTHDVVVLYTRLLKDVLAPKYAAARVAVLPKGENVLDIGFGEIRSRSLSKNLEGCEEAFLLAVTLGVGVDRVISRAKAISTAEQFVADSVASAFAEAACVEAARQIAGEYTCRPRFGVGYGDLSLSLQPLFLKAVDAQKLLNITVSNTMLMSPTKSITCIMGIENQ